ncbi:putative MFS family arabinose efflux permease [Paenibacillus taihuensis]|uniref:Putative MFS family arabinose efflux permease n=1 Tax=Paenibacillus taihuensis TaxID=1156355 RepID=A0A3D9Q0E0_9BACL|nr:MFS transporter [Paenibacillus taihuensis]REE55396.1 putative MFS family arabinose efflux permease [Paenibacillus taihuensis]
MKSVSRLLLVYIINQSLHWFIIGLILPVSSLFMLEKGNNLQEIGLIFAVSSAAVLLLELPTGGLSDALGRKRVYLLSLLFLLGAVLLVMISWNLVTLLLGYVLFGAARALSSGSIDAWFVDEFNRLEPGGDLNSKLAKANIYIPLAMGLSALAGGALPDVLGSYTSHFGAGIYSINFIAMAIIIAVQYVLTAKLVIEKVHTSRSARMTDGFRQLPQLVSDSVRYGIKQVAVFMLLLTTFAWGFAFSGLETYWQPQVKDLLVTDSATWVYGLLTAGYFISASIGGLFIGPVARWLNIPFRTLLLAVRVLLGILFLILAAQSTVVGFTVFYFVLFMTNGMASSPDATLFNEQLDESNRSTMQSLSSLFLQLGGLIGSFVHGFIAQNASISVTWYVTGGVLIASGFLYMNVRADAKNTVSPAAGEISS